MSDKRVLIVGLGIGGMSAAVGLLDAGWTPVIVERAPERRSGGYFIGLFPEGKEAATRLGVLDRIHQRTPDSSDTWSVGSERSRIAGFLDQPGQPAAVLRGDIEAGLWSAIQDRVEVRFATSPVAVDQHGDVVQVVLRDGDGLEVTETFDLVIGADGLRSTTRRLAFGPDRKYMRSLDSVICAFQLDEYAPDFGATDGIVASEVGRAFWLFPFSDRTPTALFTYRTTRRGARTQRPDLESVRRAYRDMPQPVVQYALRALESAPTPLIDSVHRVKMRRWHKGRVVLLGDSAWCLTLYSGYGATSAMRGGALLADALKSHSDIGEALEAWERLMRPFITKHWTQARFKHQVFVPSNRLFRAAVAALMRKGGARIAATRHAAEGIAVSA